MMRVARMYARSLPESEDLYQEIVLAIWRALPAFRGECSERTFLFRIAHNRGISYIAHKNIAVMHSVDEIDVPDIAPTPEQRMVEAQRGERLWGAVAKLTLIHRQVIALTLEGMSYKEIAEILGISESNVGARLTRARQILRLLLKECNAARH